MTEDDYPVIKSLAKITFPFAQAIVTPTVNNVGKYEYKKVGYDGYMKLAYLHPKVFTPDPSVPEKYELNKKYVIIRLAKLTAHHDFGVKGLNTMLIDQIINILGENDITAYISSEGELKDKYESYRLNVQPAEMHHVLAYSAILISDSQSMSVEAAMLGLPSIRYSSFAGKISVLEELEHKYKLTFGIPEGKSELLYKKLEELLNMSNLDDEFQSRRQKMLTDKIDVTAFMVWFIENYPESVKVMKEEPDYQYKFK